MKEMIALLGDSNIEFSKKNTDKGNELIIATDDKGGTVTFLFDKATIAKLIKVTHNY